MTTDFRALCAELADELHVFQWAVQEAGVGWARPDTESLIDRARAALAEADGPAVSEGREPASVTVEPSDQDLYDYWISTSPEFGCADPVGFARAVLARWGHQPAPPAEGEVWEESRYLVKELRDQADDLSPSLELFGLIHRAAALLEQRHPTPVPPAEGEVGELVAWLRLTGEGQPRLSDEGYARLTRAADLLEQLSSQAPQPILVSDRLPGAGDCHFNPGAVIGSCWCFNPVEHLGGIAWWSFEPLEWSESATHWLPATALPLPAGEVE